MKKLYILYITLLFSAFFTNAFSQISFTTGAGLVQTQDFNTVSPSTGALPSGWTIGGSGTVTNSTSLWGSFDCGSRGGTWLFPPNFGAATQSIGTLTSNTYSANYPIVARLQNNTGSAITSLTVSFDYVNHRANTTASTWTFAASTDGTTYGGALDTYTFGSTGSCNPSYYTTTTRTVINCSVNIAAGAFYYLRWSGTGTGSNGQGLGLDNVVMTASIGDPNKMTQSNFTSVVTPQYMLSGNTSGTGAERLPTMFRATLTSLNPSTIYRYYVQAVLGTELTNTFPGSAGAGGSLLIDGATGTTFSYTNSPSFSAGNYQTFTTDASGNYTGWFGLVNNTDSRFAAGNTVYPTIKLALDASGCTAGTRALDVGIKTLQLNTAAGANNCTALWGTSFNSAKGFVCLYDNVAGSGRPLTSTYTESDGILAANDIPSLATFYASANGVAGSWGAVIPNTNTLGLRRAEFRRWDNTINYAALDDDGIWGGTSGINTVNPVGGSTALSIPKTTLQHLTVYSTVILNTGLTIPSSTTDVTGVLTINTGANLSVGTNTLTLNGTVAGTGVLTGGASNLVIGLNNASIPLALGTLYFDQTTPGTSNNIGTLTMNRTATGSAILGNALTVSSLFNLTTGTFTATPGVLTMKDLSTIYRTTGVLAGTVPVLGNAGTSRINLTINGSVTSGNELKGTLGTLGIVTINAGFTYTLASSNIALDKLTIPSTSTVIAALNVIKPNAAGIIDITGKLTTTNANGFSGSTTTTVNNVNTPTINLNAGSTIEYGQIGPQSVSGRTDYKNLNLVGSGVKTMVGNVTVNNAYSISGTTTTLAIGANTLTLNGTFANTTTTSGAGSFTGSLFSNLTIGAIIPVTIDSLKFTSGSSILNNFTINNGCNVSIAHVLKTTAPAVQNTLMIAGALTIGTSSAATFKTLDRLILKSDAAATARIATLPASATIVGKINVERYIPQARRWRLLSSAMFNDATLTINKAWQDTLSNTTMSPSWSTCTYPAVCTNVKKADGYNTHITGGPNFNGINGFDYSPWQPSIRAYYPSTEWGTLNNGNVTSTNNVAADGYFKTVEGYLLFIRGDRNVYLPLATGAPTSTTTLRPTGTLRTGDYPVTCSGSFTVVGNPYASRVNYATVVKTFTGLKAQDYYMWNPTKNDVGGWVYMYYSGSDYIPVGGSVDAASTGQIESGQAIMVESKTGTITFKETDKVAGSSNIAFRPQDNVIPVTPESMRVNMYGIEADGSSSVYDATISIFDDAFTNNVDFTEDTKKMNNFSENLAIYKYKTDQYLLLERRKPLVVDDTIFFRIYAMKQKSYKLEFITDKLNPNLQGFLEDNYTKKRAPVNLNGITSYPFTIDANPASKNSDRFRVVFNNNLQGGPLPVTFVNAKAWQKNNDVQVQWEIANQFNVDAYKIERSTDGRTFSEVATVKASELTNIYNWLDENPVSGNNYYRIYSIDRDGKILYSSIVIVNITKPVANSIAVYPNPIHNGSIGLQMTNMLGGTYSVRLLNTIGQVILVDNINHTTGTSIEKISLKNMIADGLYQLEVTAPDKQKTLIKIIFQHN